MENQTDLTRAEKRLPKAILEKAIISGLEYAWKQKDFIETVNAARATLMAIIGGQVQYNFPDGTCELYWANYDPTERKKEEDWISYCNRTADECISLFKNVISTTDFEKEALEFEFLKKKKEQGVNIEDFKIFLLYFDDSETVNFL